MATIKHYNVNTPPTANSPEGQYFVRRSDNPDRFDVYIVSNRTVKKQENNDDEVAKIHSASPVINVDKEYPLSGGFHTLNSALASIPENRRKENLVITFLTDGNNTGIWQYCSNNLSEWSNPENWKDRDTQKIQQQLSEMQEETQECLVEMQKDIDAVDIRNEIVYKAADADYEGEIFTEYSNPVAMAKGAYYRNGNDETLLFNRIRFKGNPNVTKANMSVRVYKFTGSFPSVSPWKMNALSGLTLLKEEVQTWVADDSFREIVFDKTKLKTDETIFVMFARANTEPITVRPVVPVFVSDTEGKNGLLASYQASFNWQSNADYYLSGITFSTPLWLELRNTDLLKKEDTEILFEKNYATKENFMTLETTAYELSKQYLRTPYPSGYRSNCLVIPVYRDTEFNIIRMDGAYRHVQGGSIGPANVYFKLFAVPDLSQKTSFAYQDIAPYLIYEGHSVWDYEFKERELLMDNIVKIKAPVALYMVISSNNGQVAWIKRSSENVVNGLYPYFYYSGLTPFDDTATYQRSFFSYPFSLGIKSDAIVQKDQEIAADRARITALEANFPARRIITPDTFYAIRQKEMLIYYDACAFGKDNLLNSPQDLYIDINCPSLQNAVQSTGLRYERYWKIEPARIASQYPVGTYPITFNAYRGDVLLSSRTANIQMLPADVKFTEEKTIILCGDSLTANGMIAKACYDTIVSQGSVPPKLIGTKGVAPYNHEGISGLTFNDYSGIRSPFYINGKLDVTAYRNRLGVANPLDAAVILLGANDCILNQTGNSISGAETIINAILEDSPDCKIILQLVSPDNNGISGWQVYGGSLKRSYQANMWKLRAALYDHFSSEEWQGKVEFGQAVYGLDRYYGYPNEQRPISSFIPDTTEYFNTNAIHPNEAGYNQLGYGYALQLLSLQ
ncbi:MAG: SGNH/GDSL hydrolase family protein [Bacteroidales bacterium]|nr:SGNH/GDSL hydrolase family protein [Bacteroidales bacterium]